MHTYIIYLHTCILHTWHHIYRHIIDKYEDIQYSRISRSSWLEKPGSSCSTQTVLQGRSWAMGGAMMGGECAYDTYNYVFFAYNSILIWLYVYIIICMIIYYWYLIMNAWSSRWNWHVTHEQFVFGMIYLGYTYGG